MTKRRKIQIHIAAAIVIVCMAGLIVMLYAEKHQKEKGWENEFLMRYSAALNDAAWHLGQFEEMESYEDRLSCLETITNDLIQLKAYMEMHINLVSVSKPEEIADADTSGWHEAETVAGFINYGGELNSEPVESFRADGIISEEEISVIQMLKEEMDELRADMRLVDEEGAGSQYRLSSLEVYQHLAEIMQRAMSQIVQINQE